MFIPPESFVINNVDAIVNLYFNTSNSSLYSSIHMYFTPFQINLVKGDSIFVKSCINHL